MDPNHPDYEPPVMAYSLLVCSPLARKESRNREVIRSLYPNPAASKINLAYRMDSPGEVEIELLDISGKVVNRAAKGQRPAGEHLFSFDVSGLAEGLYLCKLSLEGGVWTRRFVITR
ncbi:MAG: T9SS type A sorting domain-containing protein [Methylococcales bacterium]|nr:T9SS type A sorting domain-containing protein [Methylococcales bacterium]